MDAPTVVVVGVVGVVVECVCTVLCVRGRVVADVESDDKTLEAISLAGGIGWVLLIGVGMVVGDEDVSFIAWAGNVLVTVGIVAKVEGAVACTCNK